MTLSTSISDEITGGTDSRARDTQLTEWAGEARRLEAELAQWATWGTIEVAIRNVNVSSSMEHWEGRAIIAESECNRYREALERIAVAPDCHTMARTALQGADRPAEQPVSEERPTMPEWPTIGTVSTTFTPGGKLEVPRATDQPTERQHEFQRHTGTYYPCVFCGQDMLENHDRECKGAPAERYQCIIAGCPARHRSKWEVCHSNQTTGSPK
jgi:hypothetical protein